MLINSIACRHDPSGSVRKEGRQEGCCHCGSAAGAVCCGRELCARLICAGAAGPVPRAHAPQRRQRYSCASWLRHTVLIFCWPALLPLQWGVDVSISVCAAGSKTIERFRCLGRVMAKALQDSRLLDIPFSYTFYR